MVNIEYMKALDYSMYENSTVDPAVKSICWSRQYIEIYSTMVVR